MYSTCVRVNLVDNIPIKINVLHVCETSTCQQKQLINYVSEYLPPVNINDTQKPFSSNVHIYTLTLELGGQRSGTEQKYCDVSDSRLQRLALGFTFTSEKFEDVHMNVERSSSSCSHRVITTNASADER